MAQNSRYGGPSLTPEEAADPSPPSRPVRIRRPELGKVDKETYSSDEEGEKPSPGNSSQQSIPKQEKSDGQRKPSPRKLAPTTGNRSSQPAKGTGSGAPSTDGGGQSKAPKPSDDPFDFEDEEFDEFK